MRIFLSFYFTGDAQLAKQIMSVWKSQSGVSATGFIGDEEMKEMREQGFPRIYKWIEEEVASADVVVTIIGEETKGRHFVEYEIAIAQKLGKPMVGIYWSDDVESPLLPFFPHYDWNKERGYMNLKSWVEDAAQNKTAYYVQVAKLFEQIIENSDEERRELLQG